MQNNIYKEYAEIKGNIRLLEEREAELKSAIISDLHKQKVDKIEGELGIFTLVVKKNYTYSRKLQKEKENLKLKEIEEVETGKAKVKETEYIKYTQPE